MASQITTRAWLLLAVVAATSGICAAQSPKPLPANPLPAFGNRSVVFEANEGQTSSQVSFVSREKGFAAFLTSDGMVLSLHAAKRQPDSLSASGLRHSSMRLALQFKLLGAARNPVVHGLDRQPGAVNYFIGNDRTKWHRNVPTYAEVRYENVYPGIDLVYHSHEGHMEYDFAVSPGADPGKIGFAINGARHIRVDDHGNLVLDTEIGELRFDAPVVYQEIQGQRLPVKGGYVLDDASHIRFELAPYRPDVPLVIDPVLVYSTYFGGGGTEQPGGIAVNSAGEVYLIGSTDLPDFPVNTFGSPTAGIPHVFVAKFNSTGSGLVFCDYLGGNGEDQGYSLALDAANSVYLTGSTSSSDFPLVSPFQGTYPGGDNGFLTKVSSDGANLLYSTYFGGDGSDIPVSVGADPSGNMLIAGYSSSTNLPVANAFQSTVSANQGGLYGYYGFVTKFTPDGSSLVYSTYFGGSSMVPFNCGGTPCWGDPYNAILAMALDSSGNAYVAGNTNTYDFPVTPGAYQITDNMTMNGTMGFVGKFNSSGSLQYSTYFGGDVTNDVTSVAVDGSGSAYITGLALNDGTFPLTSTSICDPNVYGAGCDFAFVTKFDPTGATLVYSTFLGPNNDATPLAVALDANNDAYVAAATASSSFTTVNGIESFSSGTDVLLVEIDASASTQVFATFLGGNGTDQPASAGLALDAAGNIYVAGSTSSPDFPVTGTAFQTSFGGNTDAFVAKLGTQSSPAVSVTPLSLSFAGQGVGSTSPVQTVLLRNMGSASLSITSIVASGDFSESDNCGNSVPSAASCTLSISFSPVAPGTRAGAITIQDDAAGSPHSISLSGTGLGPIVNLIPGSLAYSSQLVGTSSGSQAIALSNTGNAALSIASIQISGDFSETNNCPASLAATAACAINVTFTPTATGTRTGTVTVSDSGSGSPQSVSLTGTGTSGSAVVSLVPATLTFGNELVGTTSATQIIGLSNMGNAALTITNIQASGDFAETNSCPSSLAPNAGCTINVRFTPITAGARTGTITVNDSATGGPQTIPLTGMGTNPAPTVSLSPTSLTFASGHVGTVSTSQAITLSNTGNGALNIASIQITGDFAQANNCPSSLPAGSECAIDVTFAPTASGTRTGTVTIANNATNSPQVVQLRGTGVDFSLTSSPMSDTVTAGSTATYTLKVAAVGGTFANSVKLSCSGVPSNSSCSLGSNSVTPGSSSASVTMTIATTVASAQAAQSSRPSLLVASWIGMPGFGLFGILLLGTRRRLKESATQVGLLIVLAVLVFMTGCAGGTGIASQGGSGTPSGSYTITVSGDSGKINHSVALTLIVR